MNLTTCHIDGGGPLGATARLRDEIGMTTFMFKPQWPGLDHREAMRQLERFGTEVIPLLAD